MERKERRGEGNETEKDRRRYLKEKKVGAKSEKRKGKINRETKRKEKEDEEEKGRKGFGQEGLGRRQEPIWEMGVKGGGEERGITS